MAIHTSPAAAGDGFLSHSMDAIDPERGAAEADCVVIVTDHKGFDYPKIVEHAKLIVDTRNALKGNRSRKSSGCTDYFPK